jgi:hypothetical protein
VMQSGPAQIESGRGGLAEAGGEMGFSSPWFLLEPRRESVTCLEVRGRANFDRVFPEEVLFQRFDQGSRPGVGY